MNLTVLGCAGGIGGRERYTTCLLLDDDILLDAGTGIANLSLAQLIKIDHVFLSHSHLDHIVGLALLSDAVLGKRREAITIHATDKVIQSLREHLLNWQIWPDFTLIPSPENPILRFEPMEAGSKVDIAGRTITSHPVQHTVDATAYFAESNGSGLLFTGDMYTSPQLWNKMKDQTGLKMVIVDCSFPNDEQELANVSRHYCPATLLADIHTISTSIEFLIYHLKPGQEEVIMEQLNSDSLHHRFKALSCGDRFNI